MKSLIYILIFFNIFTAKGCLRTNEHSGDHMKLETVDYVDIKRFMGDWYVIANIPTFIEKEATNAIESYKLASDGTVETTFTFFKGSPDGPKKVYRPKGFIKNKETNAEWRMQFIWPFKMPFLIVDLDENYLYTVIGIPSKKYVWIMARNPVLDDDTYNGIIDRLSKTGYNTSLVQKLVQDWD